MPPKGKFTDPKLRDQVKEEVHKSDKGGAPGQWSARKAQFMAQEYKKRGGGYTTDKDSGQDESQKNLSKWTEEEWQTKEGSGEARQEDGSRKRYLPKDAWEKMDEDEKEETDQKKQSESGKGRQYVGNTEKAKKSRSKANQEEEENFEERKEQQQEHKKSNKKKSGGRQAKKDANNKNKGAVEDDGVVDDEQEEDSEEEFEPADDGNDTENAGEDEAATTDDNEEGNEDEEEEESKEDDSGYGSGGKKQQAAGQKRGRPAKDDGNKKRKTMGSKHDSTEAPAQQGSGDRLPKKGDRVTWRAMPGWVHGELQEILTSSKKVDGKSFKASKDDPRFVLKADSGKICVHKPDACYYD